MPDIIRLLPEAIANQIAAGEVVQRPASVVKELLENAIDAGATDIKLIVKDAGRTLIQVTDNGTGMSETDARMSFERHATSKINTAKDLYALQTLGFRGEALASIASVARVELKTRLEANIIGTEIIIDGSELVSQQQCQCNKGTSVAVKNLFFNTPARRNFLKSDLIEKSHIHNEFVRIALAFPEISFSFFHNGVLSIQADKGNLNMRICSLFGSNYKSRLIPVSENTEVLKVEGFILKPENARRRRGEQFFFVNHRFIKSSYLNHAIEAAFKDLIPDGSYPSFFIFLQIDPEQIDVNVHPTKTEIKFVDEQIIYQILKVAVKHSLGVYNIAPTLDFERETAFDDIVFDKSKPIIQPVIDVNPDFNPFEGGAPSHPGKNLTLKRDFDNWENKSTGNDLQNQMPLEVLFTTQSLSARQTSIDSDWEKESETAKSRKFLHLHGRFIVSSIKSGVMIIDQQRANERILFERHFKLLQANKSSSQTLLYPEQIRLTEADAAIFRDIEPDIKALGFEINEFKGNTFVVSAVPAALNENDEIQPTIEAILDNFRNNRLDTQSDKLAHLAKSFARSLSAKYKKTMSDHDMNLLVDELFLCEVPYMTPSGKPVLTTITIDELAEKFK